MNEFQSDTAMDHHEKHFSKQYAGPARWQWKNSAFINDEYRVHRHFRRAKRKVDADDITLVSQFKGVYVVSFKKKLQC